MRLVLIATTLAALASPAVAECRDDGPKQVAFHVAKVDGKQTLVIDTDIVVCGHPARPAVAYVVSAKAIEYAWETLESSFVPRILGSLPLLGGSR
jgi:hypothetical protein